jgi:hypothetical protein
MIPLQPTGTELVNKKISNWIGWGAPGSASSATAERRSRGPVASHCGEPSPQKINLISK